MNENNQQQKEVEMEEKQIESMLDDVYKLILKHGGLKQREPFNVFELCGVWSSEMRHSAILAYLLNPQSSHKFGAVFLKKFYEQIGLNHFIADGSYVETELSFDNGRMDIVISSGDVAVVIENKIYAGDQENQLKRYKEEWLEAQSGKKQALLYLTLDGHEASNAEHVDYQRISYRNDILAWLETCIKIATKKPLVKSALEQYKELIKKLTGKDMDPKMEKDITNVVKKSKENYLAAALTAKAFDGIHQEIVRNIAVACTPEGMKYDVSHCTSARFASFAYSFNTEKQYKLLFEFQQGNYHALYYGLHDLTNKDNAPHPYYNAQITINRPNGFDGPNGHGWIAGAYANTDFQNWDAESLLQHWDNDFADIKEKIKEYIATLMEIIRENKEKLDNPNQQ